MVHIPRWAERPARLALRARVRATASTWPVLRRLPGDSTRFGPPRRFADSFLDWADEHPEVELRIVDEASRWELPLPLEPSSTPSDAFLNECQRVVPATWLASMPDGRLVGDRPTVVAPDDTVFADLLNRWPTSVGYHNILLSARLPKATRIEGTLAVVDAARSHNYYHWLIEVVPRLRLLGDHLHRADRIVVSHTKPFQRDCLEAAGVPMDRLIEPGRGMHLVADELLVPSLAPGGTEESVAYLHHLFADYRSSSPPSRRLYVTRADAWRRQVANEDELIDALAPMGFETVAMAGLSVGEQARLFSEAEAVVGPDGAALANIAFAQPGAVLVELFDPGYTIMGYWELTVRTGGSYHMFTGPASKRSRSYSQWRDITAPVGDVLRALAVHGIE